MKELFGIIYNYKGIKEENYLYTAEELKKFDPQLYEDCMAEPCDWHDSTMSVVANKTWAGTMLQDEDELRRFLTGVFNDSCDDDEWYWCNVFANDLYGEKSNTMIDATMELNI